MSTLVFGKIKSGELHAVTDPGFPRQEGGASLLFGEIFPQNESPWILFYPQESWNASESPSVRENSTM